MPIPQSNLETAWFAMGFALGGLIMSAAFIWYAVYAAVKGQSKTLEIRTSRGQQNAGQGIR